LPLGLAASSYCDERRIISNRAEGYEVASGQLVNAEYLSIDNHGAAGAMCSTVLDILSWSAALRGGRVVATRSYEQMTTRATLNDGSSTGYGFGLLLTNLQGGEGAVWHGGSTNGFNSSVAYYPELDLDVVVLSNTSGSHVDRIADIIAKWIIGVEVRVVRDEQLSTPEMEAYAGVYQVRPGSEFTVRIQEGQLMGQQTGQGQTRLRAQGDHTFVPTSSDYHQIVFDVDGDRATSLTYQQCALYVPTRCQSAVWPRLR
jgi:CubicO group peptidase (beta-lactamase class C family)